MKNHLDSQPQLSWISVLVLLGMLVGCASKNPLPKDMASMAEIYDTHFQEVRAKRMELKDARERISRPLKKQGLDLDGYTREAHNEIQSIFPELPNPTLVMYLYPHLAENGTPVPGYSTMFTMYDKTHYALPGEVGGE